MYSHRKLAFFASGLMVLGCESLSGFDDNHTGGGAGANQTGGSAGQTGGSAGQSGGSAGQTSEGFITPAMEACKSEPNCQVCILNLPTKGSVALAANLAECMCTKELCGSACGNTPACPDAKGEPDDACAQCFFPAYEPAKLCGDVYKKCLADPYCDKTWQFLLSCPELLAKFPPPGGGPPPPGGPEKPSPGVPHTQRPI